MQKGLSYLRQLFAEYRSRASRKSQVFTISFNEFCDLITRGCTYCGRPPKLRPRKRKYAGGQIPVTGIDRINNALGYTPGNCAPSCHTCNQMKAKLCVEEFLNHVRSIGEHI